MRRTRREVLLGFWILAVGCAHRPAPLQPSTRRYEVIIGDRVAGSQVTTVKESGEVDV